MHSPTKNHKTQHKFKSLGYQKRLPAMRNNGYYLVFVLVSLLSTCLSSMAASLGGYWTALKDVNNYPHVTELAEFAVTEYNKQSEKNLKLVKLLKGDMQVVAGFNYRFVLEAKDESGSSNFEAVVWEKTWDHFKSLTSFTPLS
ncbi:cysteine proteinase inhibitor 1-like [Arachis duranensis]|uniref:Cysteine proteinase inhibitor 1-like n=1 Tax=Arachis duranensis TaxID=130453 RepID=A0A6P5NKM3_ARADU|nr:cysteine proteinase inhibitor 1-like [Arachis duranensis]